jgi:O-antigen ligase
MMCWRRFGLAVSLAGTAVAAFSVAAVSDVAVAFVMRDQNTEMFLSLTGRVGWWEAAWNAIVERPLLGYGAYAGRFAVASAIGGVTPTIHNTYLDVLLGTGVVGLTVFLLVVTRLWAVLLSAVLRITASFDLRLILIEATGLMAMMTVRSFLTSNMLWHGDLGFLLIVACSALIRRGTVPSDTPAPVFARTALLPSAFTRGLH